ncbi:MAG: hydrogenase iron-sulfur subunit, partial [Xanthomonadales bacterium]|nr:hydrogenase iron-sulfur subunit [Xanthomonadales bacterium]
VYGCDHGADVRALARDDVAGFSLACTGMLPPAFIEYALRGGAAGVVVATCRADACDYRLGARWTAQRLAREREPRLRDVVPAARLRLVQAGPGDESVLLAAVEAMAAGTAAAAATPPTGARAAR